MIKEKKLFLIKNTSLVYPLFYVEAENIVEATFIAKTVVDSLQNDRVVGTVSTLDTPVLSWEEG